MWDTILNQDTEELAGVNFSCCCGRQHQVSIKKILLQENALEKTASLIEELGLGKKALMIQDRNTRMAAGEKLQRELESAGIQVHNCIFHGENFHADEEALGNVIIQMDDDTDFLIAVGSGTINDITRFISFKLHLPYIIAATAPSMDGYGSTVSPLLVNGFKKTYTAVSPTAIIGDLAVIRNAPGEMIAAGLGDMLGKITALSDWTLSRAVNDEYYCPVIAEMMVKAVKKCVDQVDGLAERDMDAIKGLMEGLVLSGIAMQMSGNSRPASGSEHHLSHYWEMQHFMEGKPTPLHGIKVGAATLLITAMYEKIFTMDLDNHQFHGRSLPQYQEWEREITRCYGPLAGEVIREEQGSPISQANMEMKTGRWHKEWRKTKYEIGTLIALIPDMKRLLRKVKGAVSPKELGIPKDQVYDALRYAKEVRNRYTVLRFANDLELLDQLAKELTDELYDK